MRKSIFIFKYLKSGDIKILRRTNQSNMAHRTFKPLIPGLGILFLLIPAAVYAQSFLSKTYSISDGLASISVYIEKMTQGQVAFEGASKTGAFNALGAVAENHQVTVIGEVPAKAVETVLPRRTPEKADLAPMQ